MRLASTEQDVVERNPRNCVHRCFTTKRAFESDFVATLLLELHENWEITFGLDAGRGFPGNSEEVFFAKSGEGEIYIGG